MPALFCRTGDVKHSSSRLTAGILQFLGPRAETRMENFRIFQHCQYLKHRQTPAFFSQHGLNVQSSWNQRQTSSHITPAPARGAKQCNGAHEELRTWPEKAPKLVIGESAPTSDLLAGSWTTSCFLRPLDAAQYLLLEETLHHTEFGQCITCLELTQPRSSQRCCTRKSWICKQG